MGRPRGRTGGPEKHALGFSGSAHVKFLNIVKIFSLYKQQSIRLGYPIIKEIWDHIIKASLIVCIYHYQNYICIHSHVRQIIYIL